MRSRLARGCGDRHGEVLFRAAPAESLGHASRIGRGYESPQIVEGIARSVAAWIGHVGEQTVGSVGELHIFSSRVGDALKEAVGIQHQRCAVAEWTGDRRVAIGLS